MASAGQAPAWAAFLPDQQALQAFAQLEEATWAPVSTAVVALGGSGSRSGEPSGREALLRVHQTLTEVAGQLDRHEQPYARAFEAYMLHAGGR